VRSTAPELIRPDRALAIPEADRSGFPVAYHQWIVWHADRIGFGETVFLDGSDGSLALAKALAEAPSRELTIVTNSLRITAEDLRLPATVLVCPGRLNQRTRTTEGALTLAFLQRQRLDAAFVSGSGSIAAAARAIAGRAVDLPF
jgi:hypothetical protein